CMIWQKNAYLF
nr:immunoglobulin light chain junction region [Macaca mulatta]MPO09108.1 immunoglobulin light chain junction region [Macaca mulatta]MPO11550.1 immunoglobulin light chain junction region [Macaca mulatta]MPO13327.1 immunoglobulin light chain junction region [Macaca mulatta]MPO13334.1 immunoglobulin light chain junction region [Macaca mulatta]